MTAFYDRLLNMVLNIRLFFLWVELGISVLFGVKKLFLYLEITLFHKYYTCTYMFKILLTFITAKDAKFKWKRLRDSHREALRRRKFSTADSSIHTKPWKYEKAMEFLLPLMKTESIPGPKETPNFIEVENAPFDSPEDDDQYATEDLVVPRNMKTNKNVSETVSNDIVEDRERRRKMARSQRHEKRKRVSGRGIHQDALGTLFLSLYEKTRALPRRLQLQVQREVFDSVTRAEEEALSNDPNFHYPSSSSNTHSSFVFANELNIKKCDTSSESSTE